MTPPGVLGRAAGRGKGAGTAGSTLRVLIAVAGIVTPAGQPYLVEMPLSPAGELGEGFTCEADLNLATEPFG